MTRPLFLIAAALALASAADAQGVAPPRDLLAPAGADIAAPRLDLADRRAFLAKPPGESGSTEQTAQPRTTIDHDFSADGFTGQVGYLCGIDTFAPDADGIASGPPSTFGRRGTFLGAKLGYAFK
ncbi:MAG: hypothetical protein ABI306_04240 [Caulobacteraceae bacterium]